MSAEICFVLSQSTRLTDGRTDGLTDAHKKTAPPRLHSCSAVKMIAASGFLTALECTKFVLGWGTVPDPAEGA